MIAKLVERAHQDRVPAVVMTFSPHPISILRPEAAPSALTTLERKAELLADCGVDCVFAYPTDWALLRLAPDEFFQSIIVTKFQARGLVEGENFFYGHDRAGNVQTLSQACNVAGMSLDIIQPLRIGPRVVSSSVIRGLIAEGDVTTAGDLLGADYQLQGQVIAGAARGRTLGFPTANLVDIATEIPRDGVYAGRAIWRGTAYRAAINVGPNPTFAEQARKFEVHLLDFQGDLYGQSLAVEFVARLRETRPFASVDELRQQLQNDISDTRQRVTI